MAYYGNYGYYEEPDESIYNLIPQPMPEIQRPPMYRSSHNPKLPPSYSTFGTKGTSKLQANCTGQETDLDRGGKHKTTRAAGTIGKSASAPNPHRFLKKTEGAPALPPPGKFERKTMTDKRQAVPRRIEKPVMGLRTEKNFVVANAVENILTACKKPPAEPLRATSLPEFGKTPRYLQRVKQQLVEEAELVGNYGQRDQQGGGQRMRELTEDERQDLVAALKQKWESTHKQYLAMTFSLDTVTKIQRKEALEAELEQLEKAIAKMSKKIIYVYDDAAPLW
eukprot:Hpha_TRINITY_DN16397_c1_g1::TRINITY_DN16397_c1_g1_i2::g.62502::m.62502